MNNQNNLSRSMYILTVLFIIILIWGAALQFIPEKTMKWNYLYNSGYALIFFFSGVAPMVCGRRAKIAGTPLRAIDLSSLALLAYGAGLIIWTYYNLYYSSEVPYPSLADALFVTFYPLMLLGVYLYVRIFSFLVRKQIIIEALMLLLVLSSVIFSFIDLGNTTQITVLERFLNIFYPFSSALVLSMAIMIIRVGGGAITVGATLLSLGLISHGLADFFFSIRSTTGEYWNGDYTDILFALSAYLIGMASLTIISKLIPDRKPY